MRARFLSLYFIGLSSLAWSRGLSAQTSYTITSTSTSRLMEALPIISSSAAPSNTNLPLVPAFESEGVLHGDPGVRVTKTDLPIPIGDPLASADIVVSGIVVEAKAHLARNNTGVYTTFSIAVEEVFRGNGPAVAPNSLVTFEMAGGAVRYPSGDIQSVKQPGLGFPQLGHTFVFLGKQLGPSVFQLLQSFMSIDGVVKTTSDGLEQTSYDHSVSDLASQYPSAISSLRATEDSRVPTLDFLQPGASVQDPIVRDLRYKTGVKYLATDTPFPHLPHYKIAGRVAVFPIDQPTAVVLAHVDSMTTHVTSDGTGVYSLYDLHIRSVLSPLEQLQASTTLEAEMVGGIVQTQPGEIDRFGVYGAGTLNPNADYVMFLRRTETGDGWRVIGSFREEKGVVYSSNRHAEAPLKFDSTTLQDFERRLHSAQSGALDMFGRAR